MSQLIDSYQDNTSEHDGRWYFAKPLNPFRLIPRIKDAWRIISGKSVAVHFYEDIN